MRGVLFFPLRSAGRRVRLWAALVCAVCLVCAPACKKEDKFSEYALDLTAALEECSFAEQEAIALSFDGAAETIPAAAERLYIALRREGLYFGGPLMLLLSEKPDWGKRVVRGELLFPLSPGAGPPEYLDRALPAVRTTKRNFPGGQYQFVRYHGPLEAIEAGYARLESFMSGFKPQDCVFVFEDNLRDMEKRFHVRVMARIGGD